MNDDFALDFYDPVANVMDVSRVPQRLVAHVGARAKQAHMHRHEYEP
jgi:hypothetical protein